MKCSLCLFATTVALALAASTPSQADPFQYSYNWTVDTNLIGASQRGGVVLTSNGGGTTNVTIDTAAANVTWFSSATSSNPEALAPPPPSGPRSPYGTGFPSGPGNNYLLTVTVGDGVVGDPTGTITFGGFIGGSLTHDSANLGNTIIGVSDGTGSHWRQTFGVIDVDGTQFTVSYNGFTNPTLANPGAISFHIEADPQVAGGPTAPEPSSMVLCCLGLMVLGGVAYRVRQRKAEFLNTVV